MKITASLAILCSFFVVSGVTQSQPIVRENRVLVGSAPSAEIQPSILYAEWTGKNLLVEGENFADGAFVLVDGQRFKSANDEAHPGNFLHAKKAKKKVARDQVIQLQVQNPDGATSNEFTFYSGFVVTLGFEGTWINMNAGDKLLLYLPPKGEPPTIGWTISVIGSDQTVLVRTMDNLPIPHAQGFFEAVRSGQIIINAQGSPLCPPLPPESCGPRGFFMGFDVGVIVE